MRIALLLIGLMLLVGCTSEPMPSQRNPETKPSEKVKTEEPPVNSEKESIVDCELRGGKVIGCESPSGKACSMPTKDGGESCSDSDECEQECVAPPDCEIGTSNIKGTCAERTHMVCNGVQTVEDGACDAVMIT